MSEQRIEQAKSDYRYLKTDLDRFRNDFSEEIGGPIDNVANVKRYLKPLEIDEVFELANRVRELVEQLDSMVSLFVERSYEAFTSNDQLHLAQTANAMREELKQLADLLAVIESRIEAIAQSDPKTVGMVRGRITQMRQVIMARLLPLAKRIATRLWRFISTMLTPNGWKISGSIGNDVFGLGKAQLEISFGP